MAKLERLSHLSASPGPPVAEVFTGEIALADTSKVDVKGG